MQPLTIDLFNKHVPCVVALSNFLERYRYGLASYVPDPANSGSNFMPSSILRTAYDPKTEY